MVAGDSGKNPKEVGGKFRNCVSLGHSKTSTLLPEGLSKSVHHTPELLEAGIFIAAVPKCLDPGVKPLNSLTNTTMDKGVNKHVHITAYYHFKGAMWITVWELLLYRKGGQKSLQWAVVMARVSDFLALMWRGWHFAQNQIPFRGAWHSALLRNSNRKEKNSNLLPLILLIPHKKWSSNAILKRKILDMEDTRLHTQVSPAFLCSTNPAAIRQFHNPKQI